MELRHVLGNTWVAEANTALLPVYKITEKDIVLIDTGYAKLDRSGLTAMIEDNGFHLRGVICSHAHFDHSGNVRYLQQRCGARAAAHIIEAGISVNPDAYRANYVALTYGKSREYFLEECFVADAIIGGRISGLLRRALRHSAAAGSQRGTHWRGDAGQRGLCGGLPAGSAADRQR